MTEQGPRATVCVSERLRGSNATWSAFVELLRTTPFDRLEPRQRNAHLVYWYDDEVHRSGHAGFLRQTSAARTEATVEALRALGADRQATILAQASERWRRSETEGIDGVDAAYHRCDPDPRTILASHLEDDLELWIRVESE